MQLHFRPARPDDAGEILSLLADIGALHHNGRPDIFKPDIRKYSAEDLTVILQNPDSPILVAADENDKTVGYIFAQLRRIKDHPLFVDRCELDIDDFCVRDGLRGQHVGTRLFDYCKQYAAQNGVDIIYLNVWEFNQSAAAFYERLGMTTRSRYMELRLK